MRKLLLAFLLLISFPSMVRATVYYVANEGSDSANGTSVFTPWQTLAHVNSQTFNPGDSILLNRGDTWVEILTIPSSGSAVAPITFGAYGSGNNPVISGFGNNGTPLTGFTNCSGNVWQVKLATQPAGLIISTCSLIPQPSSESLSSVTAEGNWFWSSDILYVYSIGPPNGAVYTLAISSSLVELNGQSYITLNGLTITGDANYNPWAGAVDGRNNNIASNYITIEDCNITQNYGFGMRFGNSSYDVITANTISYNSVGGIEFDICSPSGDGACNSNSISTQNTISNNTFHDNVGAGFRMMSDGVTNQHTNFSIYDNTSYNNSSGLYPGWMQYSNIYSNLIYDNTNTNDEVYGMGITSCSYNNFYNNVIHDNGNKGIDLYADATTTYGPSIGNKFFNNFIYNHTCSGCSGISFGGKNGSLQNNIFSYNIFVNNFYHIVSDSWSPSPYNSGNEVVNNVFYGATNTGLMAGYTYNNQGTIVENNIFMNSADQEINFFYVSTNFLSSNNIYYHPAGGTVVSYNGTNYTASDISSFEPTAITSNPLFTNSSGLYSTASDFRLQSGSPAIDAGVNVGLTSDFAGTKVPQGSAPDIGAYEWINTIPIPSGLRLE